MIPGQYELRPVPHGPSDLDSVAALEARGEIDIANAPHFEEEIRNHLQRGPLIVDLTPLDYLDSAGFAALQRLQATGSISLVLAPASNLHRAAQVLRLPFHSDVKTARRAF